MAFLLELKDRFNKFYNKYDTYFVPVVKFLVALVAFIILSVSIGDNSKLGNPLFAFVAAVVCAFIPNGGTILLLSLFMLVHLYSISAEFALIALCVIIIMYLLYFRFTPKSGYIVIITAALCMLKLPYLAIVSIGLLSSWLACIPVSFGVIIYYIIRTASQYESAISDVSLTDSVEQISYLSQSLFGDKGMVTLIVAFAATIIITYCIRRLKIDNSWVYAIACASALEFIVLVVGQIALGAKLNIVLIVIGVLLGVVVAYICKIVFFSLDYKRTEYVQYEDDEYYYYVKAVPKINVSATDVKVKHINAKKTKETTNLDDIRSQIKSNQKNNQDDDEDVVIYDDNER